MNSEIQIPVVEIFDSIQGEGPYLGTLATFIRLAGCNLNCKWCDTDFSHFERLRINEISDAISRKHIIITGGEPTINPKQLKSLVTVLKNDHPWSVIHLETNGTSDDFFDVDVVAISPKIGIHNYSENDRANIIFQILRSKCGFLKFPVEEPYGENLQKVIDFCRKNDFGSTPIYVMPVTDTDFSVEHYATKLQRLQDSMSKLYDESGLQLTLTLQAHKIMDVK